MENEILRAALGPTDRCLSVEQLGRYHDGTLTDDARAAADMHIRDCLNCQAELALLVAVMSSSVRPGETELAGDRSGIASRSHWVRFTSPRLTAVAAGLLVTIAAGSAYLLLTPRVPELSSPVTPGDEVTRSLSVRLQGPAGDVTELPRRFGWLAVDRAVRYRVRLMTVDRQELWSAFTPTLEVDLPPSARTSITPGRTLLWDVTAYDAAGAPIAGSELQPFRVVAR
jgi:hypothetical protein